jgi:hypothetical protein
MTSQAQITTKSVKHLAIFEAIHEKYHENEDDSFNVNLDINPLSNSEKALVVEAMSYKYTAILLQIGYLIRKSPTGEIQVPAHFIAGHGENGAQCHEKTVDRFIAHTRDVLIKCEDDYKKDANGEWKRVPHKISLTKFGIELYTLFYTMFFGNCTRAIRKKGCWEKTYQKKKKEIRDSFHKKKQSLKDILIKSAYNFSSAVNIVHKWYTGCFRWGKDKLKALYEQLHKKNVPSLFQKMSPHKKGTLFRRKKEEIFKRKIIEKYFSYHKRC